MLWKHAAHLLENTTVKVWFYWNHKYVETALRHGCSPLNLMHSFRTHFPKNTFGGLLCNFIEMTLRHGCPPVYLQSIFITPFPKNTFRVLLLNRIKLSKEIQVYCFLYPNIEALHTIMYSCSSRIPSMYWNPIENSCNCLKESFC